MASEYRITKVSEQDPKEWQGQFGTVYYHKVMLDGHNKPVTIGSKSKDAPILGSTIYGDIQSTTYPEDKFKKADKFGSGGIDNSKIEQKLDAIHGDLKLALSFIRQQTKDDGVDNVVDLTAGEILGEEEADLSAIPF